MSKPWCLIAMVAAAVLASPLSSVAQEPQTQQVQLEEGWNLVSLNVRPADSSFASIFGADAEQVAMVKNENGEVYAPDEGIDQITTWKAEEGYQIHAEAPTALEVTGTAVRSDSTSIVLKEGGNIVPYLPASTQAVAPALTSVQEALVEVQDENGDQYAPSMSSPTLDSLRSGQAYKVYVARADTLRYPVVVSDLAEAKRLEGVEVGATVRIRGYAEPGDGGGGTFEVTDSGGETDGGTVFVFNEDLSAEQSSSFNTTGLEGEALPDPNIVWGTVGVQLGQSSGQPTVGNERLHGHHKINNNDTFPLLEYSTGTFQSTGNKLKSARNSVGGTGFIVRYKHATSTRRLVRKGVYNSVNVDWWGAPEADPNNPENARVPIAWAINKAAELYQERSLDWAYVDIPGEYYYRHRTLIRDGVKLRGASDDPFGNAANGEPTYGKLTIMPGLALNDLKSGWNESLNNTFQIQHDLAPANKVSKVGVERLEVDGNIDENLQVFQNMSEYGGENNIENNLQNGNKWNGFYTRGAQATDPAPGAVADFSNSYFHDFPGNGIAQEAQFDFSLTKNLRVGDAPRNHSLYDPRGTYEGLTVDGSSWFEVIKITKKSTSFSDLKVIPKTNELDQYLSEDIQTRHILSHGGKKRL